MSTALVDLTLADGSIWRIPQGWRACVLRASRCRSCAAAILWAETPLGKHAPLNQDGSSHFSTCPNAGDWRRKK